jgi:hypothetical protein
MRLAGIALVVLSLALSSFGVRAGPAPERSRSHSPGVCEWNGETPPSVRRARRAAHMPLPSNRAAPAGDWIPLNTRGYNHSFTGENPAAPAPAPPAEPLEDR